MLEDIDNGFTLEQIAKRVKRCPADVVRAYDRIVSRGAEWLETLKRKEAIIKATQEDYSDLRK